MRRSLICVTAMSGVLAVVSALYLRNLDATNCIYSCVDNSQLCTGSVGGPCKSCGGGTFCSSQPNGYWWNPDNYEIWATDTGNQQVIMSESIICKYILRCGIVDPWLTDFECTYHGPLLDATCDHLMDARCPQCTYTSAEPVTISSPICFSCS
jgi:hypothetical protein